MQSSVSAKCSHATSILPDNARPHLLFKENDNCGKAFKIEITEGRASLHQSSSHFSQYLFDPKVLLKFQQFLLKKNDTILVEFLIFSSTIFPKSLFCYIKQISRLSYGTWDNVPLHDKSFEVFEE